MRSATSRWNISVSDRHQGGQASAASQPIRSAVADIVGQVRDDAGRRGAEQRARVERQRVGRDDLEPARDNAAAISASAGRQRGSRSIATTSLAPAARSARVRPPGPGPTSMTVTSSSGPAARAIRLVRLRSSRKFWPSDFFGSEAVPAR